MPQAYLQLKGQGEFGIPLSVMPAPNDTISDAKHFPLLDHTSSDPPIPPPAAKSYFIKALAPTSSTAGPPGGAGAVFTRLSGPLARPSIDTTAAASHMPSGKRSADLSSLWGPPEGLHLRGPNDENLIIFRRAIGINADIPTTTPIIATPRTLEEGRKQATGIYLASLRERRRREAYYLVLLTLTYAGHFIQIVVSAALTGLGPEAGAHPTAITLLGGVNTVAAGLLALLRGQSLLGHMKKDEDAFRRLSDWIEETEVLLACGVLGKNKKEVGDLVQTAFRKYNAAKRAEEKNKPDEVNVGSGASGPNKTTGDGGA